jgi:hypothetical protein
MPNEIRKITYSHIPTRPTSGKQWAMIWVDAANGETIGGLSDSYGDLTDQGTLQTILSENFYIVTVPGVGAFFADGNLMVTGGPLEFYVEFINELGNTAITPCLGEWTRDVLVAAGTAQFYSLPTTSQAILNHVQGTAGTPQTFQLRKVVGANEGTFTMRKSSVVVGSALQYNVSLATLQAQHADFTITDEGTYFQFTRTSNGTNGTWTCVSDTLNPVRNSVAITFETTQVGGPDVVAVKKQMFNASGRSRLIPFAPRS